MEPELIPAVGVGREGVLEHFVSDKVDSSGGHVAQERGAGAAKHGAHAALVVQLARHVHRSRVASAASDQRLAGLIELYLQQTLEALDRCH